MLRNDLFCTCIWLHVFELTVTGWWIIVTMLEIRIRNWLAVFLKIGYFIGYINCCPIENVATGNMADQNGFWSAKC